MGEHVCLSWWKQTQKLLLFAQRVLSPALVEPLCAAFVGRVCNMTQQLTSAMGVRHQRHRQGVKLSHADSAALLF